MIVVLATRWMIAIPMQFDPCMEALYTDNKVLFVYPVRNSRI